ncbi:AraC family transcriptional regulator [Scytonema hofmannii PCC 7110]|uniref:AraC family transcriptional regulator n=1 Tax=Scytonema hofmannii PCC 7110 TaxID=128403 RepID=A0A139XEI3_9CYAN|nr:AraC family transcriptional regulator [Scytonema hofmannii]KYC43100.1 AraC family transcriptional regulator [Scytonema hofmannii PCC 7110]
MVSSTCIARQSNSQVTLRLQQEELRFTKFLMDRVADPIFWIEPNQKPNAQFLYVNNAACRLVNYSHEELVSMSIQDLNLDFLINVWSTFCNTAKKQRYLSFETRHQTKEGHCIPVEITVTSVEYEGKNYSYLFICHIKSQQASSLALPKNQQQTSSQKSYNSQYQLSTDTQTAEPAYPLSILPLDSLLNQVFNFIEESYHQSISLCDVATAVGYCPAYLTNLVRRHTGKTVNHWIVERRMLAARTLLRESNLSVSQIAEAVGYQHEGHFFRQFRQNHQTTPQAWRKAQFI